jgi:hypothetical protein
MLYCYRCTYSDPLGDNTGTIKKNAETLIDASKEVGLEVNVEITKYMLLSPHKNAGQNHDIKTANGSFENVAQFQHVGTNVTNQNLIQEERVMLSTIQSTIFCRIVCSLKT